MCCWRHAAHAAFTAAGAVVEEATHRPAPRAGGTRRSPRMGWLPPAARRPLAAAYRGSRTVAGSLSQLPRQLSARHGLSHELARRLAGADLVVAESPAVAAIAAESGVPHSRLWVLALPAQRLFAGDLTGYAGELAAAAGAVGGFLTDGEQSRDSVEQVISPHQPRVELFPPVAGDRPCPACRERLSHPPPPSPMPQSPAPPGSGSTGPPDDLPEPVAELVRHRAGRLPVLAPRSPWGESAPQVPVEPAPALRAATQDRTARAVLATVTPAPATRPRRSVLLAGFDLKFAHELAEHLDRRADLAVTVDDWPELGRPTAHTASRLNAADAVFAEWARTSAIWLSQRTRPDQFLAVRLHRFELDTSYPRDIAIDNVDAVVYIAPLFGRRIRDELGWPAEKLIYIPNFLDVDRLDRPKLPEARFAIGFVGIEWSRKRFDLALDLLAAVRREDPRFRLVVRSVMPWHNPYVWAKPEEREYAGACFTRIEQDPLLRESVVFDPPGRDMARWYRRVGHLASTSDEEGSHASVAEAMASGAVPVIRPWPGAADLYGPEWVHDSTAAAARAVLENEHAGEWAQRAARARKEVRASHDPVAVIAAWAELLHGEPDRARACFAGQLQVTGAAGG